MHQGLKPHWPLDENHVTRDEVHVTYFLPNPLVSLKWDATNSNVFVIWMTFFFKKATEHISCLQAAQLQQTGHSP